jgi:hypothetical protein
VAGAGGGGGSRWRWREPVPVAVLATDIIDTAVAGMLLLFLCSLPSSFHYGILVERVQCTMH